jgi:hypothetical protein
MKSLKLDIYIDEENNEFRFFIFFHKDSSVFDLDIQMIKKVLVIIHHESKIEIRIKKNDFHFISDEIIYKAISSIEMEH